MMLLSNQTSYLFLQTHIHPFLIKTFDSALISKIFASKEDVKYGGSVQAVVVVYTQFTDLNVLKTAWICGGISS